MKLARHASPIALVLAALAQVAACAELDSAGAPIAATSTREQAVTAVALPDELPWPPADDDAVTPCTTDNVDPDLPDPFEGAVAPSATIRRTSSLDYVRFISTYALRIPPYSLDIEGTARSAGATDSVALIEAQDAYVACRAGANAAGDDEAIAACESDYDDEVRALLMPDGEAAYVDALVGPLPGETP